MKENQSKDNKGSDDKKLTCTVEGCNATFNRKWRLESHIAVHDGKRPFKCEHPGCKAEYANLPHLKRHVLEKHSSNKRAVFTFYPCTYSGCWEVLKSQQNFNKHVQRKHKKKEFACEQCPESFSKRSDLDIHVSRFHDGPPLYKCKTCPGSVGFTHVRQYKRHMRVHKLHLCPVDGCLETTDNFSLLRKHMAAMHPPDFTCDYCGRSIRNKERFIVHIRRHLKAINENKPFRKQSEPVPSVCDICSYTFSTKASLNRHKVKMHRREDVPLPEKPKRQKQKKRCDAGTRKTCEASRLSGLHLPPAINKALMKSNKSLDDDVVMTVLSEVVEGFTSPEAWELDLPAVTPTTTDPHCLSS